MIKRRNGGTVRFLSPPSVISNAACVGKKEGDGPLSAHFDAISWDDRFGEKTWEKSEASLQRMTLETAISKVGLDASDIDMLFSGDLLNQCIASGYCAREMKIPMLGLYGACSTMAEGLSLAAMMTEGGFADVCAAVTSSHFCSAERQFRFPLEYGGQRTPTSQRTVTGSGAVILSRAKKPPYILHSTVGRVIDMGIKDINNMGAAMAPAACSTLVRFFTDTGLSPDVFDLILTGDLGVTGTDILLEIASREGLELKSNYDDCGRMIFDTRAQDTHSGGSGCGCSAAVVCSYVLNMMRAGKLKHVLFVGTGALMSPIILNQKESIPAVAHAVHISSELWVKGE
ncbi:MAG: stage V sporulation protein AD [Clostridia bacterium]|nr:stage V sporulation protein AD [Clostridia bacterium]